MRIRKFNESLEKMDFEYIKECFVDFIDDDSEIRTSDDPDLGYDEEEEGEYFQIEISVSLGPTSNNPKTLIDFVKSNEMQNNILLDINNCIEKVNIKYDYYHNFYVAFNGTMQSVTITFNNQI